MPQSTLKCFGAKPLYEYPSYCSRIMFHIVIIHQVFEIRQFAVLVLVLPLSEDR